MKKAFLSLIGAIALTAVSLSDSAHADQFARLQAARALIALTIPQQDLERRADAMAEEILQRIRLRQPDLYVQRADRLRGVMRPILLAHLQRATQDLDQIAARVFELDELEALTAFYRTEVGARALGKMQVYLSELQPKLTAATIDSLPRLFEALSQEGVRLR